MQDDTKYRLQKILKVGCWSRSELPEGTACVGQPSCRPTFPHGLHLPGIFLQLLCIQTACIPFMSVSKE